MPESLSNHTAPDLQSGPPTHGSPEPAETDAPVPTGLLEEEIERTFAAMCLIRATEEKLLRLFSEGALTGTTHTYIGQEAIAVAVAANLTESDLVFSHHRCHGHFLAYGGPLVELLAEVMGRDSLLCGGRGGSQHLHYRNFYSNGVQGGVVGNAVGMALAERMKGSEAITVAFLGDGTLGEGLVYESFNFAALRSLPILFVLENNRYAQTTPVHLALSGSIIGRARAFGIDAAEIESNDAVRLHEVFRERLASVRARRTPFLQVVHTYRLAPHSKGDDFRDPQEIEHWRKRDPLRLMRRYLPEERLRALEQEAEQAVTQAVALAERRSYPLLEQVGPPVLVPTESFPVPWATSGQTGVEALNRALHELLASEQSAFVMGQDLLDPYGGAFRVTKGLSTRFPDRVITTPISEAGIVAWGTGAALRGLRPVVEIMFGDFLPLAADQIVNHAAKYRWMYNGTVGVPLVIRTPMGGRRGYGPTHSQSLEALFSSVPGLCLVAPSHLLDPGELLLRGARLMRDPVVFLENKQLYNRRLVPYRDGRLGDFFVRSSATCFPTLHLSLTDFEPPDVTLVCFGGSAPLALEAAFELLMHHERVCDVIVASLVAPLPREEIRHFLGACRRVAVLEDGNAHGGWGAEVLASLAEREGPVTRQYIRFGGPDSPLPASRVVEEQLLPSVTSIVTALARW